MTVRRPTHRTAAPSGQPPRGLARPATWRPAAAPVTAGLLGGLLLTPAIAAVPLSQLAHQSLNASGGSVPVWISAAYGAPDPEATAGPRVATPDRGPLPGCLAAGGGYPDAALRAR